MKKHKRLSPAFIFDNSRIKKVIIGAITFIILFFICSLCIIPKKYKLKVGDISPTDINAPRDFQDEIETKNKVDRAILNVQPQYNKNIDIQKEAIKNLEDLFVKVDEVRGLAIDDKAKADKLKSMVGINISKEDCNSLLSLNSNNEKGLLEFMKTSLTKIYSLNIRENNEDDMKKAQDDWNFYIRNSNMEKSMKELATNIGINFIKPNMFYDEERTQELKNTVKKQVEPVMIKKNQNIILKGEVVTEKHVYLMQRAGLLEYNRRADIQIYAGMGLSIFLLEMSIALYLKKFRKDIYKDVSKLTIISIVICVNTLFNAVVNSISGYLIPAALLVITLSFIFDPTMAIIVSIPYTVVVAFTTNFNYEIIIMYLFSCISAILFLNNSYQRSNVFLGGFLVGVINAIVALSQGFINTISIYNNVRNSIYALIGGILSTILAIGILPLFEQMFDIITPIKLLELSNPDQPLIKKLLFEAPGTYHHSIIVGNLAETAADAVGASSLLARVGSYYHDIGKIKRPYFFKENQVTDDNPHDKITPKLSALIITSHVKDGIEIAKEYKLPGAIKNIIAEHHGTTLVKYFYVMAVNDGNEEVKEESFRYDGPKPSSKESAIVMLADSTEAAVRSLKSPTIEDIKKMVDKIIDDKIADGQLVNCDLTLKDIDMIKTSFTKVLSGSTHSRIEYPEMKENKK